MHGWTDGRINWKCLQLSGAQYGDWLRNGVSESSESGFLLQMAVLGCVVQPPWASFSVTARSALHPPYPPLGAQEADG